jgi:bifunctional non-homologous end joining protein LigD
MPSAQLDSHNARDEEGRFIEPMLVLKTESLPQGEAWSYEIKLDGYRAIAFKTGGTLHLRSRNDNDFSVRYYPVLKGPRSCRMRP